MGLAISTGTLPRTTFAEPGVPGPLGTGIQGIGVCTPRAAGVAAITAGIVGELHIPNVGMFAIGIVSAMVAIGQHAGGHLGPSRDGLQRYRRAQAHRA